MNPPATETPKPATIRRAGLTDQQIALAVKMHAAAREARLRSPDAAEAERAHAKGLSYCDDDGMWEPALPRMSPIGRMFTLFFCIACAGFAALLIAGTNTPDAVIIMMVAASCTALFLGAMIVARDLFRR